MKPSPNAAPTSPMLRERFSFVVTSAMHAIAVEIFPPLTPSMIRPSISIHTVCAAPSTTNPTAVPRMLTTSTGLRPTRSLHFPNSGEHTSWSSE